MENAFLVAKKTPVDVGLSLPKNEIAFMSIGATLRKRQNTTTLVGFSRMITHV